MALSAHSDLPGCVSAAGASAPSMCKVQVAKAAAPIRPAPATPHTPRPATLPPEPAPPAAKVIPSRTAGPAPLAVLFDVAGDFATVHTFDFGDPAAGVWPISGLPKNTHSGAGVTAHVYTRPGTYTATVAGQRIEINVVDPAVAYPGAATVCVSPARSFTGCPTGAAQVTTLPASYSGKRVLLARGQAFGAVNPQNADTGFQVGAFGDGAKPIVSSVSTGTPGGGAVVTSDWTVMDLQIGNVNIDASTARFLLIGNDIRGGREVAMVNIGTAAGYYQSHGHAALAWPREVFLVENTIEGVVTSSAAPGLVVMGHFLKSAILGNSMDRAQEHTLRVWTASKLVVAHNRIGGTHYAPSPPGIRQAIKIHSGGVQPFADLVSASPAPATDRIAIASNVIGSTTFPGSWLMGLGPQNADAGTVEGMQDIVLDANTFVRGPWTSAEAQLKGRRITSRKNRVSTGAKPVIVRNGSNFDPGMAAWDGPYFLQ
jgi:hypothetical protein